MNKSIFIALSVALLFFNACRDPYFKNEPKDGTRIFCYGFECLVNGVKVESDLWFPYRRLDYEREFFPIYDDIFFSEGVLLPEVRPKDYYVQLAFILQLGSNSIGEWGEWKDIRHPPFFFYIAGDGLGPFVAGKEYSSPNNVVYFYPGQFCGHHDPADIHFPGRPPFNFSGLEVKLLTSSFRFGYSQIMNEGMGMVDVLDFYFDFEELIVSPPEGYSTPGAGDTIRVSNGHFRQAISGPNHGLSRLIKETILPQ